MIEVKDISVFNLDGAIRGMRNPLNSWNMSDSTHEKETGVFLLGKKDIGLAQRLLSSGTADDSKFMRQIMVSMDITAPLYWWKEMDQYKVATTTNSTSTMHKLASTEITRDCFSFDKGLEQLLITHNVDEDGNSSNFTMEEAIDNIIYICEELRQRFKETKSTTYWRALVQFLPEAWNQTRTWTANYQVLRNIYFARRYHKLTEWHKFCQMIEELPYAKDLICWRKEDEEKK